jgi:hypothetical protein
VALDLLKHWSNFMPSIRDREEGSAKRRERIACLKQGPGWFKYNGSGIDTEFIPTPLLTGHQEPILKEDGMPLTDSAGRQKFKPAGKYQTDDNGAVMLGGIPKVVRHKIQTVKLRGLEFPEGKPVFVADKSLALKLRGMDMFDECAEGEAKQLGAKPVEQDGGPSFNDLRRIAKEHGIQFSREDSKEQLKNLMRDSGVEV